MIYGLLDPWFLLELYATICRILLAIVILGVVAECVCMLFLCHDEKSRPRRAFGRRDTPMLIDG